MRRTLVVLSLLVGVSIISFLLARPLFVAEMAAKLPPFQLAEAPRAERGTRWSYTLKLVNHVVMGPDAQLPGIDIDVTGVAQWTVASDQPGMFWLNLDRAVIKMRQAGQTVPEANLEATRMTLTKGAIVRLRADGGVVAIEGRGASDQFGLQILRQIGSLAQISFPADARQAWTSDERDGSGTYQAAYKIVKVNDSTFDFAKQKNGYEKMESEFSGNNALAVEVTGKLQGSYFGVIQTESGWLKKLHGQETAEVFLGTAAQAYSTVTTNLQLDFLGSSHVSDQVDVSVVTASSPEVMKAKKQAHEQEIARAHLGAATFDDLRRLHQSAHEAASGEEKDKAVHDAFIKTKSYVILHQKDLDTIKQSMQGLNSTDPWTQTALDALSSVGCPECQAAVIESVKNLLVDPSHAQTVIHFLASAPEPSGESEQYLRQLVQSPDALVHNAAELALGTVAFQLATAAPERAAKIVDEALAQLREAKTDADQRVAFAILGNTGSSRLTAALGDYFSDPKVEVRVEAYKALSLLHDDEAAVKLMAGARDQSPLVRKAALESMGLKMMNNKVRARELSEMMRQENEPSVRVTIVHLLQAAYRSVPEARQAVRDAAQNDPVAQVRNVAHSIVLMYPDLLP